MIQAKSPMTELQNLVDQEDKIPTNIKYKVDDSLRNYVIQIQGLPGTNLDGAYIILDMILPLDFPVVPPTISVRDQFKHMNVQIHGEIQLYFIKSDQWKSTTSLLEIIIALNELLHHPNHDDPSNEELLMLYTNDKQNNTNHFNELMGSQTIEFRDNQKKVL